MLTFSTLQFDMGDVKFGNKKSFPVNVKNESIETIVLHHSGSSCSCTTASVDKNPILPNTNTNFNVHFNSNKTGKGSQVKSIIASWNENGQPKTQKIQFKVNVT